MTDEEWESKSPEWRKGYNTWAHDETGESPTMEYVKAQSQEWQDGFFYAVRNVGAVVPMGGRYE